MALLSDLVRIVAEVEGLEEVSVGIFARHAREAGYISQGGRGRSAAKMSVKDAANLLIAVNGCALAKDVSQGVERIRQLPIAKASKCSAVGLAKRGATFGEDLERLLEFIERDVSPEKFNSVPGQTTIVFHRPFVKAEIEIYPWIDGKHVDQVATYRAHLEESELSGPDRMDQTSITQRTLYAVVRAITQ